MERQRWRTRAKIVGMVDSVLVAVDCLVITVLTIGALVWGPIDLIKFIALELNDSPPSEALMNTSSDDPEMFTAKIFTWIGLGIGLFYCLFEVVSVWKLMLACRQGCEITEAARKARFWRNVKILFFLIYIKRLLDLMRTGLNIFDQMAAAKLVTNLVGISVVQMFIKEMDDIIKARMNRIPILTAPRSRFRTYN